MCKCTSVPFGLFKKDSSKATQLLTEAQSLADNQQFEAAMKTAERAKEEFEKLDDDTGVSQSLGLYFACKGYIALEHGDNLEAATALGRSIAFYTKLGVVNEIKALIELQAKSYEKAGREKMKEKKFSEAASIYEQAALAYFRIKEVPHQLECRAKAYVCRAAGEKTLSGRKNFLKQAIDVLDQAGIRTPTVRGLMEYYTALFMQLENPQKALPHLQNALNIYMQIGNQAKVREVQAMIDRIMNAPAKDPVGFH